MKFGAFDHIDRSLVPLDRFFEKRLKHTTVPSLYPSPSPELQGVVARLDLPPVKQRRPI
jgi:hypothetical protein